MPTFLGQVLRGNETLEQLTRFFRADADAWDCLEIALPHQVFGLACNRSFARYLEGPSQAEIRSLDDICAFLRDCQAVDDHSLFQEPDFWQHPVTFEQLRKGDCEDHSLWAWRQLHRLGQPARFVTGLWRGLAHAWLVVQPGEREHVLETTAKSAAPMLIPGEHARADYVPALAVDHQLRTFAFQGYQRLHLAQLGRAPAQCSPHPRRSDPPESPATARTEIVILAGGLGSRLGRDKARVPLGGRSMLARIRAAAAPLGHRVRVQRRDLMERSGPLGGVVTALGQAAPEAEVLLFLACDMPLIGAEFLAEMLARTGPRTPAVFATREDRIGFPFTIRRAQRDRVLRFFRNGGRSLFELAEILGARRWAVPRRLRDQLFNVNTPADLAEARRMLATRAKASPERSATARRRTRTVPS